MPRAEFGVNESGRVECRRNPRDHGFHPADEDCPYCVPADAAKVDYISSADYDESGYWRGNFYGFGG